jgi:small subunit ribosomal protein S20
MANTVTSIKRVRITERRTAINQMRTTKLRHSIRSLRRLLDKKDVKGAEAQLPTTYSVIDRSAKLGIIKKNTAARYKSRVTARLKALQKTAA